MVVIKNLSGFTPAASLGSGLSPMEAYGEKSVIATNVGSFWELHVNCMATACVVDNTAALFRLMALHRRLIKYQNGVFSG